MDKNRPVWEVRLGSIRCSIFINRHGERSYSNVTLTRRFKQGTEWMTSSSFNGLADLAQVRQAVELAIAWLAEHEAQNEPGEE